MTKQHPRVVLAATLSSAILREMKKGATSRFKKTDRGHFALNV